MYIVTSLDFWLFGYLKQQLGTYSDAESFKKSCNQDDTRYITR